MRGGGWRERKKGAERKERGVQKSLTTFPSVNVFPTHGKYRSKPGSQSDSSFGDPVCPVGNAKTPIAIVIVDNSRLPAARPMHPNIYPEYFFGCLDSKQPMPQSICDMCVLMCALAPTH